MTDVVELGFFTFFFNIPAGFNGVKTDIELGEVLDPPVIGGRIRFSGSWRVTFFFSFSCFSPTVF